jgi:RNA polymerase sigma-70 factor, ECF subfamily
LSSIATRFQALPVPEEGVESRVKVADVQQVPELSDDELLARLQEADKEALSQLFRRYARIVRSIGERIVRDRSEAEDIVQETFLYIFRKAGVYKSSKCSARSWILQVSYSQALQRRRRLVSRHFYQSVDLEAGGAHRLIDPMVPEYETSPEGLFGRAGWKKVLDSLSEGQRQTLRMHFFEGRTLVEISEELGESLGNVRNHYYRAEGAYAVRSIAVSLNSVVKDEVQPGSWGVETNGPA